MCPAALLNTGDASVHSSVTTNVDILDIQPTSADQRIGTVVFSHADKPMGTHITSELETTYRAGGSTDVPLGQFLERPVLIRTEVVSLGDETTVVFDPWSAFLNDFRIKNRLEGFKHVRGHLKLRATITGNPFLYGRFIMAYEPRAQRSMHAYAGFLSECYIMQLTQLPHIFLDPTRGEGGEMTLPFFCPENWLDLTNNHSVGDMGEIRLRAINPLKHANSTSGSCTIRIYAWMEDAEICTPTAADYGVWEEQSEFSEHPISSMATAVERVAGMLTTVPQFAPFAKATEIGASAVGKIAKAFGFSRPLVLQNIAPYRNLAFGQLALTNTHEVLTPIALDAKRELTVDPRTVGLPPVDEMAIPYICGKECFIHEHLWAEDDVIDQRLFSVNVTPQQFETDSSVSPFRSCLTPSAYIAQLFGFWRGTVILRFQVVASSLHRGKLRIVYEPSSALATVAYNEQYSRIIDLETTRDFEIPIQWHAREPFLQTESLDIGSTFFNKGNVQARPQFHNGCVHVTVMNPLVSPDPTLAQSVSINCYMRMGDDVEFAVPVARNRVENVSYRSVTGTVQPQSGIEADAAPQDNNPVGGEPIAPVGDVSISQTDQTNLVYFGESISSLRTLMRRYTRTTQVTSPASIARRAPVSSTVLDLHEYILALYAGWRGSHRFKVGNSNPDAYITWDGSAGNLTTFGWEGVAANYGVVETEVPYYNNKRFSHARTHPDFVAHTDLSAADPNNATYRVDMSTATSAQIWRAVGEDFTCFFFIGTPLLYAN